MLSLPSLLIHGSKSIPSGYEPNASRRRGATLACRCVAVDSVLLCCSLSISLLSLPSHCRPVVFWSRRRRRRRKRSSRVDPVPVDVACPSRLVLPACSHCSARPSVCPSVRPSVVPSPRPPSLSPELTCTPRAKAAVSPRRRNTIRSCRSVSCRFEFGPSR